MIYVASPIGQVTVAREVAGGLRRWGITVTSRWHDTTGLGERDPELDSDRRSILTANLEDIARCDVLLALTHRGTPRATFGEIGWALATGKDVVWIHGIGDGRCLFDAHPRVQRVLLLEPQNVVEIARLSVTDRWRR